MGTIKWGGTLSSVVSLSWSMIIHDDVMVFCRISMVHQNKHGRKGKYNVYCIRKYWQTLPDEIDRAKGALSFCRENGRDQ